ncbi:uncharacterized protein LOC118757040 [Rhagoletis pomonella]|uniref:uncharacterized protein LOC118757040 n=1 Tax=Rhagoletis pomonella TaxID=28610 RepID=UPI00177F4FB2|nr:uncharacterized protein LOC118757040 [Rhagoletis pomonella]
MFYELKYTFLVFVNVLCLNYISYGAAYPWQADHEGYDASLDPVIWSRAFVKDYIRRPRQFTALPSAVDEANEIQLIKRFDEFQQRFVDTNRAASDILRDESHRRTEAGLGRRRFGAVQVDTDDWSTATIAERRSSSKRKSSLNRSKIQHRRKRNHIR